MDRFDIVEFEAGLQTRWLGRQAFYQEEVGSTNDELKKRGQGTAVPSHGAVFITDYQVQGRGRFDRRWEAPPGSSLLFSLQLYPGWPAEQNGWLTMMASLAVTEAIISQTGLAAGIKWPNDVVLPMGSDWHKVSGILLEGEVTPDGRCRQAVLGMGINVNIPFGALPIGMTPTTSLLVVLGRPVSRLTLLLDVLTRLENLYDAAIAGRSPKSAWQDRLVTLGKQVTATITATGVQLCGTAVGVDAWGHLLLQTEDGRMHSLFAADVTLRQEHFDNSKDVQ